MKTNFQDWRSEVYRNLSKMVNDAYMADEFTPSRDEMEDILYYFLDKFYEEDIYEDEE